jgi:type IV secretory pathway VirJ component
VLDGAPDAPALPSARRIDWAPLTCIQGEGEPASLCPLLHGANVRRVALPGGHFMNYDVPLIARTLRAAITNGR